MPTTFYEHRGGRLYSSKPEVEWDEEQFGWMLALRLYRQGCCPTCGGDLRVTADSENEGKFKPDPPLQCFRCVAFSRSHKNFENDPHPQSLLHLVPRTPS